MIDWLVLNADALVAAANFTIVFLMGVLACSVTYILYSHDKSSFPHLRLVLWGLLLEAIGWFGHRAYWGLWRYGREHHLDGWNEWFVYHGYLPLIATATILAGLTLILTPVYEKITGISSRAIPFMFVFSLYWFLFWHLNNNEDLVRAGSRPTPSVATVPTAENAKRFEDINVSP